jgi:hypothetical protein
VILLSSKKSCRPEKEAKVPTKPNANVQNLISHFNDTRTECQEMKLSDFFKPGPFKRKATHIQNTSPKKKRRLGIVYSKPVCQKDKIFS